jgi:hypothetical protein
VHGIQRDPLWLRRRMRQCVKGNSNWAFVHPRTCPTKSSNAAAGRQELASGEVFRRTVVTCHSKDKQTLGLGLGKERETFCSGLRSGGDEMWSSAAEQRRRFQ